MLKEVVGLEHKKNAENAARELQTKMAEMMQTFSATRSQIQDLMGRKKNYAHKMKELKLALSKMKRGGEEKEEEEADDDNSDEDSGDDEYQRPREPENWVTVRQSLLETKEQATASAAEPCACQLPILERIGCTNVCD